MRKRGIDLVQVVRSPQSRVTGPDDRDVGGDIAGQLLARSSGRDRPEASRARRKLHVGRSSARHYAMHRRRLYAGADVADPHRLVSRSVERTRRCGTGMVEAGQAMSRMPTDEKQPHPTLPIRAAWGAVITLLVSLIAGRYLLKAISSYDWPIAVYVTILAIIGYAPAIGVVLVLQPSLGHRSLSRRRRPQRTLGRCRVGPAHVGRVPADAGVRRR